MSEIEANLNYDQAALESALDRLDMALAVVEAKDEIDAAESFLQAEGYYQEFPEGKAASLDRSPKSNWVERAGGLPSYIRRIAVHLIAKGMSVGHAIAVAVNAAKKMCATGDVNWPGHQNVNAGSRAQACAAVASWEAKKARS